VHRSRREDALPAKNPRFASAKGEVIYLAALGNRGEEYSHTRHNVGQLALDELRRRGGFSAPSADARRFGRLAKGEMAGKSVIAFYPDGFMNESGRAVAALVSKKDLEKLIVIHDDVDLPLGTLRLAFGRGDGGHRGVASIIAAFGSNEFARLRIGIGLAAAGATTVRPASSLPDYVLGKWTKKEETVLPEVLNRAANLLEEYMARGRAAAMNKYN
jgi:PTH1 family peptidyl-tRNA hydrolase